MLQIRVVIKRLTIFLSLKNIVKRLKFRRFHRHLIVCSNFNKNRADYCNAKRLTTQEPPAIFGANFFNYRLPKQIT